MPPFGALVNIRAVVDVALPVLVLIAKCSMAAPSSSAIPFKIMLVADFGDNEQELIGRYVNTSVSFIDHTNLEFQLVQPPSSSVEKAYQEICTSVDYGAASFILSVAREKAVTAAVYRVARISSIPTVQVDYSPFFYDKYGQKNASSWNGTLEPPSLAAHSDVNYFTVLPPTVTYLNSVPDFLDIANITGTVAFLYDDTFKVDMLVKKMLASLPKVKTIVIPIMKNEAAVDEQLADLKMRGVKFVFLMLSIPRIETFVEEAQKYMDNHTLIFIVLTKDIRPFTCDECNTAYLTRLGIDTSEDAFGYITKFKEYIYSDNVQLAELITPETEVVVSFFLDLTRFAHSVIMYMNSKLDMLPIYGCFNGTMTGNKSTTLSEVTRKVNFRGIYGRYEEYETGKYYQNILVNVFRFQYIKDYKFKKLVGSWTITEGMQTSYGVFGDILYIKPYRVTIVQQPPFIQKVTYPNGTWGYEGYCIDLIQLISQNTEPKFQYDLYEVKDKAYGAVSDQGEWNGLIRELMDGNAEIALAALSATAERENVVDFTVPYDLVGMTILMKKQPTEYSIFKFMTVLEGPVWGCIVGAYFFTSFLLWVFDRFSPYSYRNDKEKYKDDPEKREFTLKECLWFCVTALTPQGGGDAPKNISGRLLAATWWLFGFIIIAWYTANLAALLTVSRLETQISSLDDLAKQYKIKYAPVQGTVSELHFKRMAEMEDKLYHIWKAMCLNESTSPQERAKLAVWYYPVSDKFTNMYRYMQEANFPHSTEEAIAKVKASTPDDGFSFIGDATEIKYAALTDCELQQVGGEFGRRPYAIAVQQSHPLKHQISRAILKLQNQRELERLKEKWWSKNPNKVECSKGDEESDGISIQNIGGVFILVLVGIVLSLVTLAFEYWYYKYCRTAEDQGGDGKAAEAAGTGAIAFDQNGLKGENRSSPRVNASGFATNNISLGHFNAGQARRKGMSPVDGKLEID